LSAAGSQRCTAPSPWLRRGFSIWRNATSKTPPPRNGSCQTIRCQGFAGAVLLTHPRAQRSRSGTRWPVSFHRGNMPGWQPVVPCELADYLEQFGIVYLYTGGRSSAILLPSGENATWPITPFAKVCNFRNLACIERGDLGSLYRRNTCWSGRRRSCRNQERGSC